MNIEKASLSVASMWAITFLALLSIGPLVTGLDLLLNFLPQVPAIQSLHAASSIGQALWVGSGVLGAATILLMLRRSVLGVVACLVFAASYISGAKAVWLYFTPGCWLAIAAVVLSVIGTRLASTAFGRFRAPE
ncbi:hypothetical protein AB4059_00525 [Lysobacter sp. 2RAF19]